MTCIVYRDNVLASDSCLVSRQWSINAHFQKVGRKGDTLYAATGETAFCQKFYDWVQSSAYDLWRETGTLGVGPNLEPAGKDEVCTGMLFNPDGSCTRFEGNYPPFVIMADFYAFGSGDTYALGALGMGATASEAVEQAITFDVLSNGPIQTITR